MNINYWIKKLLFYTRLEAEVDDFDLIHTNIEKEINFKGTNLWILIFAIFVASIGLNMNSTAVIIGAMLISPLMGPINGMGYSIATYNFELFRRSVKNFTFAVIASLLTSFIYFSISPISTAHSELLARTSPSIYDVLIALFGGLAGIVAISSRLKGNVIPGVAIATALMPPLCTAGYGLATAQFFYFFGALYLFTINTVFIAFSSIIVSQILKFPIRTNISSSQKTKINRWISLVISLIFIPSIYFGYQLVKKEQFVENAKSFVKNVTVVDANFLIKHEINNDKKTITLLYAGKNLSEFHKKEILERASLFNISKENVFIHEGFLNSEDDFADIQLSSLNTEISVLKQLLNQKQLFIDSVDNDKLKGKQILNELSDLYPQIDYCSFGNSRVFTTNDSALTLSHSVLILKAKNTEFSSADKNRIKNWLKTRLNDENLKVFFEK